MMYNRAYIKKRDAACKKNLDVESKHINFGKMHFNAKRTQGELLCLRRLAQSSMCYCDT
jgi:hypothetical protein